MKQRVIQALSPILLMCVCPPAGAQFDTVVLHPTGKSQATESLDSTRYKVRAPESRKDDFAEETPGTMIASPVPKAPSKPAAKEAPAPAPATTPSPAPAAPAPPTAQAPNPAPIVVEEPPPVTVQVKELILGGSEEDIDEAKRQIHPEDPRANILNITLAPAYFYTDSSSNYSFRNYHSDGPALGLGMNLWFTPFFGVHSKYFTSVSSGVRDGGNMVPMGTTEFEAGIRFRKHFGFTRKSAQISWGIDYHDAANKISSDSTSYIGRKTSGLSLSIEGVVPTSNQHARTFELAIRPWQHHAELETTATAQSGTKAETNAISLAIGSLYTLDRNNQVFWKGQYSVERNLFNGDASVVDPQTGVTPTGVSVTNSTLIFYFGLKWGS